MRYNITVGKRHRISHLEGRDVDWRTELMWILKKWSVRAWVSFCCRGIGTRHRLLWMRWRSVIKTLNFSLKWPTASLSSRPLFRTVLVSIVFVTMFFIFVANWTFLAGRLYSCSHFFAQAGVTSRLWSITLRSSRMMTNCTEQSPSWEANRFSANQEIPRILWNPKLHYRIHNSPLPVPVSNPVQSMLLHITSSCVIRNWKTWSYRNTSLIRLCKQHCFCRVDLFHHTTVSAKWQDRPKYFDGRSNMITLMWRK